MQNTCTYSVVCRSNGGKNDIANYFKEIIKFINNWKIMYKENQI